jgi:hypothetical protein
LEELLGGLADQLGEYFSSVQVNVVCDRAKRLPSDFRFGQLNVVADGSWQSDAFFS